MNKTIQMAIDQAVALQRSGRIQESIAAFQAILAKNPEQPEAMHGLGVLLHINGQHAQGLELVQKAVARKTTDPEFRNSLGVLLSSAGHLPAAAEAFERAIKLNPTYVVALVNFANLLINTGHSARAVELAQRVTQLNPRSPDGYILLSGALFNAGKIKEAGDACLRALQIAPNHAQANATMGNIYTTSGMPDEAISSYRKAVTAAPDYAGAWSNLANALEQRGMIHEAHEAILKAVTLDPRLSEAQNNYGNILKDMAQLDDAVLAYHRAIAVAPDRSMFHSNLVYAMWFMQQCDPAEVLRESEKWATMLADPLTRQAPPITVDRNPNRKVRIGYVSSDFRQHPIGRLIYSILACRDHSKFDVVLFSGVPRPDAITQAIYQSANRVHGTNGMSDEALANLIRSEKIDILIDLTLHMAGTRMQMFARKPAPIQITYLAYCATSGMKAMDYCVTDVNMDPIPPDAVITPGDPGIPSKYHSEKLLHLPQCYWCYTAPGEAPEVNALPALTRGKITFGSLNSFTKTNYGVLDVWCDLMREVPTSDLLIVVPGGPPRREEVGRQFAQRGVDPSRLKMVDIVSVPAYFRHYLDVDIALDPFPYNGGTTTMDALYMGTPVVALEGGWATARAGVTILRNLPRTEWIAADKKKLIEINVALASDIPRLAQIRAQLRPQMLNSPLTNARRFAGDFETLYSKVWKHYCETGHT